jgi:hypothetical protein
MPSNALSAELLNNALPDDGMMAVFPATTLDFKTQGAAMGLTATYNLTRKPSASAASFSGSSLTIDALGYYQATVTMGTTVRTFLVVCFPLGAVARGYTLTGLSRLIREPNCTTTTLAAVLEAGATNPVINGAILGSPLCFNQTQFAT